MNIDANIKEGNRDKPTVFFVHGLGMDKKIWESPDESRILGGKFPVSLLVCSEPEFEEKEVEGHGVISKRISVGTPPKNLATLFHDFKELGYTVIAWTQQRPSAGIEVAVSELRDLIAIYEKCCKSGIILVGHSRGGLVARKYLEYGDKRIKGLITLATPHRGSRMAQWVKYVAPLISLIEPLLPDSEKGTLTYTTKRVFDFLKSRAVKELLPDSRFFKSLDGRYRKGIYSLSFGGNNPTLFSVFRKAVENKRNGDGERLRLRARKVFSIPEIFEKLIPERLFPDEMKKGKGDGLVSVESSRLSWADEHYNFDINHAGILFDDRVRSKAIDAVKKLR